MLLLGNMRCRYVVAVTFCALILMIYQAKADKEDKSEETLDNQTLPRLTTTLPITNSSLSSPTPTSYPLINATSTSSEEGPPDSHEALHNRELKPKLTVSGSGGGRDKRSYEFLVGLVRNQSGFEMTRAARKGGEEGNVGGKEMELDNDDGKIDMKAAGDLMEMLVKISSHPKEWKSVHEMLVEIDNDLQKSKRILDQIETTKINISTNAKKSHTPDHRVQQKVPEHNTQTDIKKWPFDENETSASSNQHTLDSSTKRQNVNNNGVADPTKVSYPHNFAYHRVTGKPLYHHTNSNSKGPKAYIAVSVIAPKNPTERDEMNLENELRQLKPWTHQQNLKNMADIRSKWVIQSSKEREE